MDKIEIVQKIGCEICEECGSDRDCGLEYEECSRIQDAVECLNEYIEKLNSTG